MNEDAVFMVEKYLEIGNMFWKPVFLEMIGKVFIKLLEEYVRRFWQKCVKPCEEYSSEQEKFRQCVEKCREEFRSARTMGTAESDQCG